MRSREESRLTRLRAEISRPPASSHRGCSSPARSTPGAAQSAPAPLPACRDACRPATAGSAPPATSDAAQSTAPAPPRSPSSCSRACSSTPIWKVCLRILRIRRNRRPQQLRRLVQILLLSWLMQYRDGGIRGRHRIPRMSHRKLVHPVATRVDAVGKQAAASSQQIRDRRRHSDRLPADSRRPLPRPGSRPSRSTRFPPPP